MSKAEELANAHWKYVEEILTAHFIDSSTMLVAERHYITAFIHGYKHGITDGSCSCNEKKEPEFTPWEGPLSGPDVPGWNPAPPVSCDCSKDFHQHPYTGPADPTKF